MNREEIRVECLRLALECREAGQGPAETIAIAAALEAYVAAPAAASASAPARHSPPARAK